MFQVVLLTLLPKTMHLFASFFPATNSLKLATVCTPIENKGNSLTVQWSSFAKSRSLLTQHKAILTVSVEWSCCGCRSI